MSDDSHRGRRRPSREYSSREHSSRPSDSSRRPRDHSDSDEPRQKYSKSSSGNGRDGRDRHDSRDRDRDRERDRDGRDGRDGRERREDRDGKDSSRQSSTRPENPFAGNDKPSSSVGPLPPISGRGEPGAGGPGGKGRARRERYEIVHSRPADVQSKCGENGQKVRLHANYFRLLTTPTWKIFQYHVDFSPEVELRRVRGGILSEHRSLLGGYLYDGMKLFTTTKLREDKIVLETKSKTGQVYNITIKFVGIISMTEWQSLQILNLILRRAMEGLKLQLVGRNFFDPVAKIDLREYRLQLWPGYDTSIRQHEKDILLCTEIAHKVMRTDTVYDILVKCTQTASDYKEDFKRHVLGMTVLTDYTNKTYRINDIDFSSNPTKTFKCKEKDVSFIDYYYEKYNIRIRDPKQPMLISKAKDREIRGGNNEPVILIPELCRATGLTDNMRSNFQLMRAMAEYTRMNPDKRIDRLKVFNNRLQTTDASVKVLKDWDMSLDKRMVELTGRVLPSQNIIFANTNKVNAGDQADWTRSFRDNGMFTTPSRGLDRWAVVSPNRSSRECRNFVDSLMRVSQGMGFRISRPKEFMMYDDRSSSYITALDQSASLDPQLVLCMVPNNNGERYGIIKKKMCCDRAIPTQVITHKVAANQRGLMSVATKVAIQINSKLGYAPWMIDVPLSGLMTIGFDISRSTRDKSVAYGALVATMDIKTNASFYSTVAPCHAGDTLSNDIWIGMTKALHQYKREHDKFPARIILYRDGVGEGSLNQLVEHEVKEIVTKLQEAYSKQDEKPPKFAYIVVTKQINTRFFENGRNPKPGTVVDDVVTLPERYDFYLVSQSVRQGTVSPTSYNVVYSNIKLTPDQIQMLTYKMCHLYYNWSGTTRVPAVVQYAKKLATLVSQSIFQPPANALEKKLYYL